MLIVAWMMAVVFVVGWHLVWLFRSFAWAIFAVLVALLAACAAPPPFATAEWSQSSFKRSADSCNRFIPERFRERRCYD